MPLTYRIDYQGKSRLLKRICDRLNDLPGLGTQHHTAFYGDWGQEAFEHSQMTSGNPHNVTLKDLGIENIMSQVQALIIASGSVDEWSVSVANDDDDVIIDEDTDEVILLSFVEDALIWS